MPPFDTAITSPANSERTWVSLSLCLSLSLAARHTPCPSKRNQISQHEILVRSPVVFPSVTLTHPIVTFYYEALANTITPWRTLSYLWKRAVWSVRGLYELKNIPQTRNWMKRLNRGEREKKVGRIFISGRVPAASHFWFSNFLWPRPQISVSPFFLPRSICFQEDSGKRGKNS